MVVKIFKGVWFFALMASIAALLYVYASLPEVVQLTVGEPPLEISRSTLFYLMLAAFAIFNVLVFVIGSVFPDGSLFFKAWSYGLVSLLNLFLIVAFQFVSLLNSLEKFDYSSIGAIIYGSIALIVLWSVAYPVYYITQRLLNKQAV